MILKDAGHQLLIRQRQSGNRADRVGTSATPPRSVRLQTLFATMRRRSKAWDAQRARLSIKIPRRLPAVMADERGCVRSSHLVDNAVKYTPPRGELAYRRPSNEAMRRRSRYVTRESGSTEATDRLFEPFYRSRAPRPKAVSPIGLGLAVVRGLVEANGGTISVVVVLRGQHVQLHNPLAGPTKTKAKGIAFCSCVIM